MGGQPGQPGENLILLNNLLIIEENGLATIPDDNVAGGTTTVDFDERGFVLSLGFLDIEDGVSIGRRGKGRRHDDQRRLVRQRYVEVPINEFGVRTMDTTFNGEGALAFIKYVPVPIPEPSSLALLVLADLPIAGRRRPRTQLGGHVAEVAA